MVHTKALVAATAALLLASPAYAGGLYPKSSAVLQVDAKNYDSLIAQSNYTSIVEFYAPWCGHCKNLQPAYETAAKKLAGIAKVAAVNCDEDANKQFCGGMGVKGFPTLKIVKPGKQPGRPVVEDYQGPREAKDIMDAVTSKMKNHVSKITDKDLEGFLKEHNDTAKAILFTEKGTISPLLKAIAIDFLGSIKVGQVRSKEAGSVELFGITKFPTIVLLPGGSTDAITYEGEMKKDGIVKFLSQIAAPNPDPAPKAKKETKQNKKEKKSAKSAQSSFKAASESHKSSEASSAAASATEETIIEDANPTESPDPRVDTPEPVVVKPKSAPIPVVNSVELFGQLAKECLNHKSGTCVLAFVPAEQDEVSVKTQESLADVVAKYKVSGHKMFPVWTIPVAEGGASELKAVLGLIDKVSVIAINAKRGWMRQYSGSDFTIESLEAWVDTIRMGKGKKTVLPGILIGKAPQTDTEPNTAEDAPEATPEPGVEEELPAEPVTPEAADPVPEPEVQPAGAVEPEAEEIPKTKKEHDEL